MTAAVGRHRMIPITDLRVGDIMDNGVEDLKAVRIERFSDGATAVEWQPATGEPFTGWYEGGPLTPVVWTREPGPEPPPSTVYAVTNPKHNLRPGASFSEYEPVASDVYWVARDVKWEQTA